MEGSQLLFVAGLARSGTTVLRRILAAHPDIALGMERYKGLWGARIGELNEELFERERFFDWSDGLTNITPEADWAAPHLAALESKWDTARYRGDKMTIIRAQRIWQSMPEAKFIFIVRDVASVASSWQRRSDNPDDDGWRTGLDARGAIEPWNRAVGKMLTAARRKPGQTLVLEYERTFGDPEGSQFRRVGEFLDLDPEPLLAAFAPEQAKFSQSIKHRDRSLSPAVSEQVAAHADHDTWRELLEHA